MQFYNDLVTQKSFAHLKILKNKYDFILIGGWAVFLYSRSLKSKDIDIIINYDVLGKIKEEGEVIKNDRLKKYEIKEGNFDIDIYIPRYSELGVNVEEITKYTINKDGFLVPELEILFLLKLFAWHNRRGSAKGQKDELDIFSLAFLPEFDWKKYSDYVDRFNFSEFGKEFKELLNNTRSVKELGINEQKMSKFKKNILYSNQPFK